MIKRYKHHGYGELCEEDDGEYVMHIDHDAELNAARTALRIIQETSIAHAGKQNNRIRELEQHAKDSRFLLAALIQKAGGRLELTMGEVIAIDANASIVTWDDVINGHKVYMLQTLTTRTSKGVEGG